MRPGMKMMLMTQARERGTRYGDEGERPQGYGAYEAPESRFRDRTGREHYDNGRYAPKGNADWRYEGERPRSGRRYEMPRYERRGDVRGEDDSEDRPDMIERREMPSNIIGFARRQPDGPQMHSGGSERGGQMRGHASGVEKPFDHEMAKEWTQGMENADGTRGPHWTMDQARSLMAQVGATDSEPAEFWAVLNSLYSDYSQVLKKFGVDRTEIYAHLAKAWLNDRDAVPDKAAAYFEYVVDHG